MPKNKSISEESWIDREFAVDLGDKRREKRLKKIAADFGACLEGSVLEASGDWAGAKGAYRFFDSDIEPEELLGGHRQQTLERLGEREVVLAVQDTTVLNFSAHANTKGLGRVGSNATANMGFFCHSTLVVDEEGLPLGLLEAQTYVRKPAPAARKRGPQAQECESARWLQSVEQCQLAARKKPQTRIVNVGDREADFYEFAAYAHNQAPDVGFVVRAAYDRRSQAPQTASFFEMVASKPCAGEIVIEVPRTAKNKARETRLEIRYCEVALSAPAHWNKEHRQAEPLTLWLIEARESEATTPQGEKPICWRILTNLAVKTFDEAVQKVRWYRLRWTIEVFFKVLKDGCRVEERQLETRERLERVLMLDLIMAWRVLYLTMMGRAHPNVSAQAILEEHQWKALHCFEKKTRKLPQKPPSLAQAITSIAKLGGFAARKRDGHPGPTVIWRGLSRLDNIAAAYLAFGPESCG